MLRLAPPRVRRQDPPEPQLQRCPSCRRIELTSIGGSNRPDQPLWIDQTWKIFALVIVASPAGPLD